MRCRLIPMAPQACIIAGWVMTGNAVIRFIQGLLNVEVGTSDQCSPGPRDSPRTIIVAQGHDPLGKVTALALLGHGMTGAAFQLEAHKIPSVEELVVGGMDLLFQLSLGVAGLAVGLLVAHGTALIAGALSEQPVGPRPIRAVAGRQLAFQGGVAVIAAGIG